MQTQSMRQQLVLSFLLSTAFGLFTLWRGTDTVGATVVRTAIIFGLMFLTMRGTNRVTVALTKRFRKEAPTPEVLAPPEPTSERPEHAQRRRRRRRRRGRGRRV